MMKMWDRAEQALVGALGILMFRRADEVTFRRIILLVLFFSGLSLVI